MITRFYDVTVVTRSGYIKNGAVDVENGKIKEVYNYLPKNALGVLQINCGGAYAAPGFVDIHVHGGGGIEFMNADAEKICIGCRAHALHGTTTIIPTTLAASPMQTIEMIKAVKQAQSLSKEQTIAGVHLEGPFLSPAQSGAQSPDALALPDSKLWQQLYEAWPKGIKIVGAAPELPGALKLGKELERLGITASIAHSDADYSKCIEALENGFKDITHIYSGCSMVHRKNGYRFGGVVEAGLLDDRFTVQIIADGKHLPPELLKLIVKCKGADKISLITDALFAAAGDFTEGDVIKQANGMETVLEDDVMKLMDRQAFAGSVATADLLVKNMVLLAGVPLYDAVTMASTTPARIIGLEKTKGSLCAGYDADIVLLDEKLVVKAVMANGKFIQPPQEML